jgi:hypothetical protein
VTQPGYFCSCFASVGINDIKSNILLNSRSLVVRIAGASVLIAAPKAPEMAANLYVDADILDSAGLSLLFLTAIGFLGLVYVSRTLFVP